MAKDKARKQKGPKESKEWHRARAQWQALEAAIGKEFAALVEEGYDIVELETLRWDYRYDKLGEYKLTREQLEYFVAEADAVAAGLPAPPKPGEAPTAASVAGAAAPQGGGEYKRQSEVDVELIEKYLEKRISHKARDDFAEAYKAEFGEELVVPQNLDLVDVAYTTREIAQADRAVKLSKAEILGLPEDAKPQEAAPEPATKEATPVAAKGPSRTAAAVMAFSRGVPQGPTRDEKWSVWNPFRFWLIPKRLAGSSVGRYYLLLIVNLVIFLGQFILILIPFAFRGIVFLCLYIWKRFLKSKATPAFQKLKEKAAVPPAGAGDSKKEPSGAKSG